MQCRRQKRSRQAADRHGRHTQGKEEEERRVEGALQCVVVPCARQTSDGGDDRSPEAQIQQLDIGDGGSDEDPDPKALRAQMVGQDRCGDQSHAHENSCQRVVGCGVTRKAFGEFEKPSLLHPTTDAPP